MSQYLEALRQAMVIYPMIVVLFTVPYITWGYYKEAPGAEAIRPRPALLYAISQFYIPPEKRS